MRISAFRQRFLGPTWELILKATASLSTSLGFHLCALEQNQHFSEMSLGKATQRSFESTVMLITIVWSITLTNELSLFL